MPLCVCGLVCFSFLRSCSRLLRLLLLLNDRRCEGQTDVARRATYSRSGNNKGKKGRSTKYCEIIHHPCLSKQQHEFTMQFLQLIVLIISFLYGPTEATLLNRRSCSNQNDSCGVRKVHVHLDQDTGCETKCVRKRKVIAMLLDGWACGKCPPQECFNTREELQQAVDRVLSDPLSAGPIFADTYGWPMGKWCFTDNIQDMSWLFANADLQYRLVRLGYIQCDRHVVHVF